MLAYTFLGGLTSAIYNEVLQFFLIVLGFSPLAILAVNRAGGWSGIQQRLPEVMTHTWKYVGSADQNPMGVEAFGLVAGLGFVLSFGYWCTDFLVVQRAMAANSMSAARRTPLMAAFPKMIMPFIVILPGIAALALTKMGSGYSLPLKGGGYDYDQALTTLMAQFYPSGMLGVGLTALMASFMSGMAGNVTAFNTVFTYDIYQSYIRPNAPRPALSDGGAADHGRGRDSVDRDGVPGGAVQQHHGLAAAGVRVRERAAVCHVPARHVLEARHGARRIPRVCSRALRAAALTHGLTRGGRQGRVDRDAAHVPFADGAEFLDRDLRLDHLFCWSRSW